MLDAVDERRFNIRVIGQSKIVVAAKADDRLAIDDHFRLLWSVTDTAETVEVLIRALVELVAEVFQVDNRCSEKAVFTAETLGRRE